VIAGEDENVLGLLGADGINILIDGVGSALIPLIADALHGGKDFDELPDFATENVPALADVAVEGKRFVLGEDVDAAEVGVEAVGESDIDDAIHSPEGDGGLGAVTGKGIEAFSGTACEKDSESVFHGGHLRRQTQMVAQERRLPRGAERVAISYETLSRRRDSFSIAGRVKSF
jgi:hypothetical protein